MLIQTRELTVVFGIYFPEADENFDHMTCNITD